MFGVSGLRFQRLAGASRPRRAVAYALWCLVWLAAHFAGGAFTGSVLGAAGSLVVPRPAARAWILAVVLCLGAVHHLGLRRLPMPQWHRQVQRPWMGRWPPAWTAVGYGLQLGAAFTTRISNFATYAALCAALLSGGVLDGAAIMSVFGFVRAIPAIVAGPAAATPQRSFALAFRVGEWEDRAHRASGYVLLLAAVFLAAITRR